MSFPHVNWTRPKSSIYPRVWHRFEVKNKSGNIERYRIQDLPISRTEDAITFMVEDFCKDEPLQKAYNLYDDNAAMQKQIYGWRIIIKQKAVLVCCKEGSDEIVGINMNFVVCKYDRWNDEFSVIDKLIFSFIDDWRVSWLSLKERFKGMDPSEYLEVTLNLRGISDVISSMMKQFNEFKHYGVDKYLTAAGLSVARQHRGRGFGVELLKTREIFCNEFGIKLTLNCFSSNYSNASADKAGFKLEKIRSYDDIRKEYRHLPQVEGDALPLKFMKFPRDTHWQFFV